MTPPFYVTVKLYCPASKKTVKLCIETADKDAEIVKGKPFGCELNTTCPPFQLWCLLDTSHIEVKRDND